MSPREVEVGKTYHNGNQGKRGTTRKVLEMGVQVQHYDFANTVSNTGVRYLQVKGPFSGKEYVLPLKSFAQWARGEVSE